MKPIIKNNNWLEDLLGSNQSNHRLTYLKPLEELPEEAQLAIKRLCSSRGDRAQQAVGVLLYGILSHGKPVFVASCNDMDLLILKAADILPEGIFNVRSIRKNRSGSGSDKTIWKQLTWIVDQRGLLKIIKKQSGRTPGVFEVVHEAWLDFLGCRPTDELRELVVGSTKETKKPIQQSYKATSRQVSNSTIQQSDNPTSISEHKDEQQSEQQTSGSFKIDF